MPEPWRAETKVYMASERTLINWLRTAATLGLGAAVVNVIGDSTHGGWHSVVVGHAVLGVAMCFFAIYRFWQRHELVRTRHHGTAFGDRVGPLVVGAALIALLAWTAAVLVAQEWEWQFLSEECQAVLPVDASAAPPYVYISMHGSKRPSTAICHPERGVSGVHRFALATGAYAGPATDQRTALMQAPRGMVLRDGLLYIAESSANDPGVAVFGNCSTEEGAAAAAADAGVSSLPSWQLYQRPYLGKIRPAPHIGLPPFQHPYGLVEMGSSARVALSAQNGGAAISLDLDDGEMAVLQQVEPPMSRSSNREKLSGPLRGLAVDGAGCLHVAERHLDEIVHYCPADGKEVGRTKVTSPIDVKVDMRENELLVGSFSKTHPQVLAFSLKDLHDEYHASHGRRAQDAATDAAAATEAKRKKNDGKSDKLKAARTYADPRLVHPAGMGVWDSKLYVLEQKGRALLRFDQKTTKFEAAVIEGLPDDPEHLLISGVC